MIELTLCNWLRGTPDLMAVTRNIFALALPKNPTYPAIKISRINSDIAQTFDGVTGEETATIQLDYWAESTQTIIELKPLLIAFFNTLSTNESEIISVGNLREQPSYEPNQNVFKQTLELTLSYKE
jgi:hypothetical protein